MYMPRLPSARRVRSETTESFYGLNLRDNAKDGSLRSCEGLSPLSFPALQTVKGREAQDWQEPTDLFGWDKLVVVDGTGLYYDGRFLCNVTQGQKQFAVVSDRLIVWPDRKAVSLSDGTVTQMDASASSLAGTTATFTTDTLTLDLSPLRGEIDTGAQRLGTAQGNNAQPAVRLFTGAAFADGWTWTAAEEVTMESVWQHRSDLASFLNGRVVLPGRTEVGGYSFDANFLADPSRTWASPNTDGVYGVITEVHTHDRTGEMEDDEGISLDCTVRCVCKLYEYGQNNAKLTDFFSADDVVNITGTTSNNLVRSKIVGLTDTSVTFAANSFTAGTQTASVTIQRAIPDMDFICAGDNRLWGVSNTDRTVYASSLGKPIVFYDYTDTAGGSYALAFETKGDFTGMCFYSGDILLWKEDLMHRIYGDMPKEYTMSTFSVRGVMSGASKSMCIINEVLYYLSRDGVMAYTGGTPTLISYPLGDRLWVFGGAGTDGRLYHLTVQNEEWEHLVYDPVSDLWLCEKEENATAFALVGGEFYVLSDAVYLCGQSGDVAWSAEFCPVDEGTLRKKDYRRVLLRMSGTTTLKVELWDGAWRTVYDGAGGSVVSVSVAPMRADRIRLRLSGTGQASVVTVRRDYLLGSER